MEFLVNGSPVKKTVSAISRDEYRQNARRYIKKQRSRGTNDSSNITARCGNFHPYRLEFGENATAILTLKEFGSAGFRSQIV